MIAAAEKQECAGSGVVKHGILISDETPQAKIPAALYDLANDVSEQKNVYSDHPDLVARLTKLAESARQDMGDHRLGIVGKNVRPLGEVNQP